MTNKEWEKKKKHPIILITEDTDASWNWFLEPNNEESMTSISSLSTCQVWFNKWKKYLKPIIKYENRKGKGEIIKKEIIKVQKIYKNKKNTDNEIINQKIYNLIKKNKNREEICHELNISPRLLGHRLLKMQREGHITIKVKKIKKQKDYPYPKKFYIFNLSPLFEFCDTVNKSLPEEEKIKFNEEEKRILELLFGEENDYIRSKVYLEYKNIDFLNAVLKFYVRHFYLPYVKTNKMIRTQLLISKESIRWILHSSPEDFNKELHILYSENPTSEMKKICKDINKIRNWSTNTEIVWSSDNPTDIDEDDFNYYGGIYNAFYNYNKTLMLNLGWKLIRILALMNS